MYIHVTPCFCSECGHELFYGHYWWCSHYWIRPYYYVSTPVCYIPVRKTPRKTLEKKRINKDW